MAAVTYKCPNCGGGLRFDPKIQKYKCDYCLSVFTQEELDRMKPDASADRLHPARPVSQDDQNRSCRSIPEKSGGQPEDSPEVHPRERADEGRQEDDAVVYTCPSCGASVITGPTTAATFCIFCHNPVLLESRLSGAYLPDKVVPFQYDRKEAEKIFLDYVGRKHFIPKNFYSRDQISRLSGVYYPFWVYDCTLDGELSGKAERVRTWISGDRQFTETTVYHVERSGRIHVQNLTRNALKESDRNLIDAVLPYRVEEAEPFHMSCLQGFVAQRRDIESGEVSDELGQRARQYAENALTRTLQDYTVVRDTNVAFHPEQEQFSYLLLPVWLLTYRSGNGKYSYYAMNGQTGEISGKLPVAFGKLALVSGSVAALVFAAVLALFYFFL